MKAKCEDWYDSTRFCSFHKKGSQIISCASLARAKCNAGIGRHRKRFQMSPVASAIKDRFSSIAYAASTCIRHNSSETSTHSAPVMMESNKMTSIIEKYRKPEEVLQFFESEMLYDGMISQKLDALANGETNPKSHGFYWWSVQVMYFGFALRAFILFLIPIFDPDNKIFPLVLGDVVVVLGVAFRQMWYSLCINYSFVFATMRFTQKWAEKKGCLHFMTDFSPSWAGKREQERLRLKLNLFCIGYSYFKYIIYVLIPGNLLMALFLDTMARKSLLYFCFNSIWVAYHCVWLMFAPSVLFQLYFFMWLATTEASYKLKTVCETGQKILKLQQLKFAELRQHVVQLSAEFQSAHLSVWKYNRCMKYSFLLFRSLFIPIAAANSYVLFTDTFPNELSRFLCLSVCLNQLVVILLIMSLAAVPRGNSIPVSHVCFSILARKKDQLSAGQKISLLRIVKEITNDHYPVGFTCGDTFPFETRSMMDFIHEVSTAVILSLDMITQM